MRFVAPRSVLFAISQSESRNGVRLGDIRRRIVGMRGARGLLKRVEPKAPEQPVSGSLSNQRGRTFKERIQPEGRQTIDYGCVDEAVRKKSSA